MKKNIINILLLILMGMTIFSVIRVDATTTTKASTSTTSENSNCSSLGKFKDDLQYIFKAFKIVAPILTLALSSYEFVGAITSKAAEGLQKAGKKFGTRLILVIVLYLLPVILNLILNLVYPGTGTCIN